MYIQMTNEAEQKLKDALNNASYKFLKLQFDTEGCGCAVDGVPALRIAREKNKDEQEIKTNTEIILYLNKGDQIYFEEQMTIDFNEGFNCFILKSSSQILNPRMRLLKE